MGKRLNGKAKQNELAPTNFAGDPDQSLVWSSLAFSLTMGACYGVKEGMHNPKQHAEAGQQHAA